MTTMSERVGARSLLRDRNFSALLAGQLVSGFGDQLTIIALASLIWQLTHSSLATALGVIVTTAPHAIFGFFAGPVADAVGRRRTMIACDLLRAVVMAAVPLVLFFDRGIEPIYLLVLVATFGSALFNPTKVAVLPDLVPPRALGAANSLVQVSDRTIEIAGKAAAGVLFQLVGSAVFYLDAASFLASAFMLSRVAVPDAARRRLSLRAVLADAGTGLRVIFASTVLSRNLFISLLAQMSLGVLNALTPVYLFREFSASPDAFGLAEAALAAGVVACSLAMPTILTRLRKGRLVVAGFAAYGLVLLGLAAAPSLQVALVLFALVGVANALFLIPNITIYQEHTPPELRGRVFSSRYALLNLLWLPFMVAGGAIGETVSTTVLIGLAGLLTIAAALLGALLPSVRDVP